MLKAIHSLIVAVLCFVLVSLSLFLGRVARRKKLGINSDPSAAAFSGETIHVLTGMGELLYWSSDSSLVGAFIGEEFQS